MSAKIVPIHSGMKNKMPGRTRTVKPKDKFVQWEVVDWDENGYSGGTGSASKAENVKDLRERPGSFLYKVTYELVRVKARLKKMHRTKQPRA